MLSCFCCTTSITVVNIFLRFVYFLIIFPKRTETYHLLLVSFLLELLGNLVVWNRSIVFFPFPLYTLFYNNLKAGNSVVRKWSIVFFFLSTLYQLLCFPIGMSIEYYWKRLGECLHQVSNKVRNGPTLALKVSLRWLLQKGWVHMETNCNIPYMMYR